MSRISLSNWVHHTTPMFSYTEQRVGPCTVNVGFTNSATSLHVDRPGEAERFVTRKLWLEQTIGVPVVGMNQVHGTTAVTLSAEQALQAEPTCDALISTTRGVALLTRVADCVPILLADVNQGVVAAVHAGRVGLYDGVIEQAIAACRSAGATTLHAWIGPYVCGSCYEVPKEMYTSVCQRYPAAASQTQTGRSALDLGVAASVTLENFGCTTTTVPGCTFEDPRWHSYRRQGAVAGRFGGVIWIQL